MLKCMGRVESLNYNIILFPDQLGCENDSAELVIRILQLVASVISFFYGAVYLILSELNTWPKLREFYKNSCLILTESGIRY